MSTRPRFDRHVAVVSGGASGIGRATALRLAADGAAVAVLDRDDAGAHEVAATITDGGGRALAAPVDVADDDAVADAVARARTLGRITDVVTCAGVFPPSDLRPAAEVGADEFLAVLRVNLVGTFSTIRHALGDLAGDDERGRGGAIVTVASTAALRGHGQGPGYTASKGGVDALTRLLAVQYGPAGIRANCVCPGGVDTPMTGGVFATPEARERAARHIPVGAYATADEIAAVIAFCCSDDARHLTGQTIPVEGGATIT